jgi:hypothetical protein
LLQSCGPLDLAQLNEHPEPNGWSVGQVLEHLCVADGRYEDPLAALMARSRQDAGAPAREWKPSFIGGMIAGSLLKPKPLEESESLSTRADTAQRRCRRAPRARAAIFESDGRRCVVRLESA